MTRFLVFVNIVYSLIFYSVNYNVFGFDFLSNKIASFLFFYFLVFIFNVIAVKNLPRFNYNWDLLYKFYILTLRKPSFFLNYIISNFKKMYLFFFYFKYYKEYNFISFVFKRIYNTFLIIWRPLFKKFSYFGYFRSNRSKWIK